MNVLEMPTDLVYDSPFLATVFLTFLNMLIRFCRSPFPAHLPQDRVFDDALRMVLP